MTNPETAACRTTQHCAFHGWCRRCDPAFAAVMSRVNVAIQRTDADDTHWGPLYAAVAEALRPAAVSVPPPATQATDRRARYAAAIAEGFRAFDADTTSDAYLDAELLDAVVAAADAEEAELLAAVSVVPPAPRADDQAAELAKHVGRAIFALKSPAPPGSQHYRSGWDDGLEAAMEAARDELLRRLADEAQQPQPLCGRTTSVTRTEYPPCARSAGHPEAYCRSADGKQHFLALYGPRPATNAQQPVSGPVAGEQQNETPEAEAPVCVCGDPVQLMDENDPTSWIHSPGSDTRCLEARPRCPHCQMPHDLTPGSLPVATCAGIRHRIAEAERSHAEGDHSLCCRRDCEVLRQP